MNRHLKYLSLITGSAILAFALYNIHFQNQLSEGGVLGATLLIEYWFHLSPSISGLILDLSGFALGFRILGKDFLKTSFIASLSFAITYAFIEQFPPLFPPLSPLFAAIIGGILVGIGVGLVVINEAAAGGDDAIALVLNKKYKISVAKVYLILDFSVLVLSLSYIPFNNIIYSLITVILSSKVIDWIYQYKQIIS